ncbi:hypothetical protein GCM10010964_26940 [Caldovatus sediminis]|uniref:HTH-like domain-containing protein n=1 Tax=Caldovatus sediminis TaxID=2041189 RepID=A0A8J2ZCM4_9PROT|nr:hypothetical protein GCM10010964_26940 [Caldovatus sediminis]
MEEVRRAHRDNFRVYGVRKVWLQLGHEGIAVARRTMGRLVRRMGPGGAVRGKETRTTVADEGMPRPADKANRQFRAPQPNVLRASDFTHVATRQGFVGTPSPLMSSRAASSAGECRARPMPLPFSMLWSRRCTSAGR